MPLRVLLQGFLLLALAGCADPPGLKKPLPPDAAEVLAATSAHRRLAAELRSEPGVLGTYLTQTNNPRRLVVVVRDAATLERLERTRPRRYDGLKLRYEVAPQGFVADSEAPLEAVPAETLPEGWWDRLVYLLRHQAQVDALLTRAKGWLQGLRERLQPRSVPPSSGPLAPT
ncbi:MAG: hypothetical protein VKQ33_06815 [Candidatus Sericytochromatia bacterium]|nr:hypothetical protein [Candidatus Sericytochromatia bacterium]